MVIDRLAEAAHAAPHGRLVPGLALTAAEAWAQSGAVASFLIAQGYGPGGRTLAIRDADPVRRLVTMLGALRAGAAVDPASDEIPFGRMANCSIDAAVAERRQHIDAATPARVGTGVLRRHGDYRNIEDVLNDLK
jgi:acyl-CoA synthetase (AMP-forming)/AMP-acid ligase II